MSVTASGSLLGLRVAAGFDADPDPSLPPRLQRLLMMAREVGAPIAEAIDAGLAAEADRQQAHRAITVASAQTKVVAGGLLGAPVILVPGLAKLVGADLLAFYSRGVGLLVLALGGGALLVGAGVIALMLRRVQRAVAVAERSRPRWLLGAGVAGAVVWFVGPAIAAVVAIAVAVSTRHRVRGIDPESVEEAVELIATAHAGGVTAAQAIRLAAQHLPEIRPVLHRLAFELEFDRVTTSPHGISPRAGVAQADPLEQLRAVLVSADLFGAPVASTLRRLGTELRADQLARTLAAAERLPAQLTFPTVLCLLPGSIALVGAPIVQAGLSATGA